jgi:hypothetical protein
MRTVTTTPMMLMMDSVDKGRVPVSILVGVTIRGTVCNEGTIETAWIAVTGFEVVVSEL